MDAATIPPAPQPPDRPVRVLPRRWVHQASLFQFREPAFWLFVGIIGATMIYSIDQEITFTRISASAWALGWGLLLLFAVPMFLLIYFLDLYEREPLSLVLGALVWGAVAATTMAGRANSAWADVVARVGGPDFAARWFAAFTGPPVEETLKLVGVVLIYLIARGEIDDVMDGFVYGAIVGLGFAVIEDVFYFMAAFGGTTSGVLQGFFLRVISSGLYSHALYTGLSGMGVAYFVSRREEASFRKRLAVAASLFMVAVFAHFLWNSPWLNFFPSPPYSGFDWVKAPLAGAVKGVPFLAFLVLMVSLARRRERRWLDLSLRSEVGGPAISERELDSLEHPRGRRRARRDVRRRAGPRAASLLRRLQREQVNLAMVRSRVSSDDHPDVVRQREYCQSLRDALAAIPGGIPTPRTP